jgi:Cu+-exporting ATPase
MTQYLKIDGMTCGGCSTRVQSALVAVEGVDSAFVDLELSLATVVGTAPVPTLVAAVEAVGKRAVAVDGESSTLTKDTFEGCRAPQCKCGNCLCNGNCSCCDVRVDLACDGCTTVVEQALKAVDGVESTVVDFASGTAYVTGTAPPEVVLAAVNSTGRTASLKGAPQASAVPKPAAAAPEVVLKVCCTSRHTCRDRASELRRVVARHRPRRGWEPETRSA